MSTGLRAGGRSGGEARGEGGGEDEGRTAHYRAWKQRASVTESLVCGKR